jgi:CRISPR-associated protein Cmr5
MNTTLSQKRSAFALKRIKQPIKDRDKFAKLVAGTPAMILQNGFGHTLAFLLSKSTDKNFNLVKDDKHFLAFNIVAGWLKECGILNDIEPASTMQALSQLPQTQYLQAQDEAMSLLEWVKRYAGAGLFTD